MGRFLLLLAMAASLCAQPLAFVDRFQTTLASGYTASGSTLAVSSASGLPSGATYFYLTVKADGGNTEEVFLVTSISGTTLTVTGSQAGTVASNHGAGATVLASIMAKGAFTQMELDVQSVTVANAASTGTTSAKLAKLTGAPSTAVITATTDTGGAIGIVTAGAGTSGNALIQFGGTTNCVYDAATTAGDYVQISATTAGDCHDAGSTFPTSGQTIGRVLSTNGSGGTYNTLLFPPESKPASGVTITAPYLTPDLTNYYGPTFLLTRPGAITGQTTTTGNNGGSITNIATSVIVTSSSGFPATPFIVQIGTEDIKVTTVSGTTWTITRAYDGTTGASHTDGATITLLNFQWINQGSVTATATNAAISLAAPVGGGSANWRILKQIQPSSAYTVTAGFLAYWSPSNDRAGLVFRESSSGKIVSFAVGPNLQSIEVARWNSPTSFSSQTTVPNIPLSGNSLIFLRMVNPLSGSRTFSYSSDGINFVQLLSEAFNAFITPDEIGFGIDAELTVVSKSMLLVHWAVTTP